MSHPNEDMVNVIDNVMATHLGAALPATNEPSPTQRVIKNRFGELTIDLKQAVLFKDGILGIPGHMHFCIVDYPGQSKFKLLQCVENESLCFIVVPSQADNQIHQPEDMHDACQALGVESDHLLLLFIVSVHTEESKRRLSVNAKAPIMVDAYNKTGIQHVFQSKQYNIQHMIS